MAVSLNHRLNVLGYLYLGDILGSEFAESANPGQLDIVAALGWIRDNIEAFGGDPNRVMIFGQSGGGAKVSTLLGMPSAKGLFHAAAIQSGASLAGAERERATKFAEELLTKFDFTRGQARDLQKMPLEKLMSIAAGAGTAAVPAPGSSATLRSPLRLRTCGRWKDPAGQSLFAGGDSDFARCARDCRSYAHRADRVSD